MLIQTDIHSWQKFPELQGNARHVFTLTVTVHLHLFHSLSVYSFMCLYSTPLVPIFPISLSLTLSLILCLSLSVTLDLSLAPLLVSFPLTASLFPHCLLLLFISVSLSFFLSWRFVVHFSWCEKLEKKTVKNLNQGEKSLSPDNEHKRYKSWYSHGFTYYTMIVWSTYTGLCWKALSIHSPQNSCPHFGSFLRSVKASMQIGHVSSSSEEAASSTAATAAGEAEAQMPLAASSACTLCR